jgi:multiple sugar transport system permease protein
VDNDSISNPVLRFLYHVSGYAVAVLAALLIAWSLYWVATRPLRARQDLGGKTELTILHWGDRAEDEIVESLCASFEKAHPTIKIKRINATAAYTSKLQTMIAGGSPPDVFFWNSHMLPQYVGQGIIRPIDDFLAEDLAKGELPLDFKDLYPQTVDSFRFDGKVTGRGKLYGLPTTFTPLGFFYNKTLFDKAGVAYPTDDWTWEEFEEKARAIGRLEDCYGADLGVSDVLVRLYLQSYGLDLYTDGFRSLRLREPAVIQAMNKLREWRFGEKGSRMLTSGKSQVQSGDSAFMAGKIGMIGPVGRWVVPNFRKITDFDWDFAQMPRGPVQSNMIYVAAWCVASKSRHPREAWLVARHFARPECQAISSRFGLVLPALKAVAEGPDCTDDKLKPRRGDLFLKAVERSVAMQWPTEPDFTDALTVALDESLRMGTTTVEKAMENAENEWKKCLSSPLRGNDFPAMPWGGLLKAGALVILCLLPISGYYWWRSRPKGIFLREEMAGLTMVSPWILGTILFLAAPMLISFLLAFCKWSGVTTIGHAQWVGFRNWDQMLFHDPRMLRSLWVTVYYVILMVPLGQIVALAVALLVSREVKGIGFYRSLWYLPTVLAGVGMAVMWQWVFDSEYGLLNKLLEPLLAPLGLHPPDWFVKDAQWFGVPAFVITSLWTTGGTMLIYLAGLHAIPLTLYESARIDGAGRWAQFRHITIPMLSPVILFNFIMAIIGSFQVFTQAYVMTRGGPGDATRFYVLYLYNKAFELYEMGYASAMAWLLFVVVLALTLVTLRSSRSRVHYEGGTTA